MVFCLRLRLCLCDRASVCVLLWREPVSAHVLFCACAFVSLCFVCNLCLRLCFCLCPCLRLCSRLFVRACAFCLCLSACAALVLCLPCVLICEFASCLCLCLCACVFGSVPLPLCLCLCLCACDSKDAAPARCPGFGPQQVTRRAFSSARRVIRDWLGASFFSGRSPG